MKLILCIDKKNGLAFNHRRQTRDKEQRRHMYELVGEGVLRISPYSYDLLSKEMEESKLLVSEDFLLDAGAEDFVFAEIDDVNAFMDKAGTIFLYRWDKSYMSDVRLDENILNQYRCIRKEKIKGSSHEKIIFEEYQKIKYAD